MARKAVKPVELDFTILGKPWKIRVLTARSYVKTHGKGSLACTETLKREIDLHPDGMDRETVVHEIGHAYIAELGTSSAVMISIEALEEVFCEILAKFGFEILATSSEIYHKLNAASVKDSKE